MSSFEPPAPAPSPAGWPIGRRDFLLGSVAVGAAWLLSGCGADDDDRDGGSTTTAPGSTPSSVEPSTTGGPAKPASPDEGVFPVDIDGALGTITVVQAPERVVAVGSYRDIDAAMAFGVVPLATADGSRFFADGVAPWVVRRLDGAPIPELLEQELPFEKIAALHPDLILATDRPSIEAEYAQLTSIATTLGPGNGYNKDPWQLTTARVGAALGKPADAEALIAEVESLVTTTRDEHAGFAGKTFTFGPVQADGTINTINSTTDASVVFLSDLGLELSPHVLDLPQASFPGRAEISAEQIELLDADVILLTFNTPDARTTLEANPLFQALPAVQRGAYIALDLPVALALGFPSALSIPYGIEVVVPLLDAILG